MAPMTSLALLLLLAVCVQHASCQHTAQCQNVMRAAMQYKNYLRRKFGDSSTYHEIKTDIMTFVHADLDSGYAYIQQMLCAVVDAEPRTIRNIAQSVYVPLENKEFAFAYMALLKHLRSSIKPHADHVSYYENVSELYEVTGLPTFPLKLPQRELMQYIMAFDKTTVARVFPSYADYIRRGAHIFYTPLVESLSAATSLSDFARRAYLFKMRDSGPLAEAATQSGVELIMQKLSVSPQEQLAAAQQTMNQNPEYMLLQALKQSGFMNVTRGGPPLYSCDFIADTAVRAWRYAQDILGKDMVLMTLSQMGFSLNVEADVRSKICSIMNAKSQRELSEMLPQYFRYAEVEGVYPNTAVELYEVLVRPTRLISMLMRIIRLKEAFNSVGFPTFPLNVTTEQAKQLAVMIKEVFPRLSEESIAQVMQAADADSWNDFLSRSYILRMDGSKTDSVVQLVSCLYQLLMSAEEQGLLMLPET